jgi:hypothetical protein
MERRSTSASKLVEDRLAPVSTIELLRAEIERVPRVAGVGLDKVYRLLEYLSFSEHLRLTA